MTKDTPRIVLLSLFFPLICTGLADTPACKIQNSELSVDAVEQRVVTSDGCHSAVVARSKDKALVVLDGQAGSRYNMVATDSLVLSPDGKHVAYFALKGTEWLLVFDGVETPASGDSFEGHPVLSGNGQHIAYVTRNKGKLSVVADGKRGPECDGIVSPLSFSPDGMKLAFIGVRQRSSSLDDAVARRRYFVVVNGEKGDEYELIKGKPIFSPDGARVAMLAYKRSKLVGELFPLVVVDGRNGPSFVELDPNTIKFSPDSIDIKYCAKLRDWCQYVNHKKRAKGCTTND